MLCIICLNKYEEPRSGPIDRLEAGWSSGVKFGCSDEQSGGVKLGHYYLSTCKYAECSMLFDNLPVDLSGYVISVIVVH